MGHNLPNLQVLRECLMHNFYVTQFTYSMSYGKNGNLHKTGHHPEFFRNKLESGFYFKQI